MLGPMSPRHRSAHRRPRKHLRRLIAVGAACAVLGAALLAGRYGPAVADAIRSVGPQHSGTLVAPSGSGSVGTPPSASTDTSVPPTAPLVNPNSVVSLDVPFPRSGPGTFQYATTTGAVLGTAGPVRHFRVAVESNIDVVSVADFTDKIIETLSDPRSWIAGGKYRLQQVPRSSPYQFTIYLVTSTTTDRMCAPLRVHGFTSCRNGSHVVLNLDRYITSVAPYRSADVSLDTYRTYMINHEVGHVLGRNHELCPAKGAPAPVMEQQTLGLHGCTPNPWPYIDGMRYDGPSGSY